MSSNPYNCMDYGVTTITQTGAASGCMAAASKLRIYGHGLWPRLNAGSCMWCTAPLQSSSLTCALYTCVPRDIKAYQKILKTKKNTMVKQRDRVGRKTLKWQKNAENHKNQTAIWIAENLKTPFISLFHICRISARLGKHLFTDADRLACNLILSDIWSWQNLTALKQPLKQFACRQGFHVFSSFFNFSFNFYS